MNTTASGHFADARTFFVLSYDDQRRHRLSALCQRAAIRAAVREAYDLSDLVLRVAATRNARVIFDLATLPKVSRVVLGILRGVSRQVVLIGVRHEQTTDVAFDECLDEEELEDWVRQDATC